MVRNWVKMARINGKNVTEVARKCPEMVRKRHEWSWIGQETAWNDHVTASNGQEMVMKQPEMVWDGQEMARNWTTNWELFVIWSVFLTKMACRGNGWDEVGKPPGNSRKIDSKWFEIVKKWPWGVFSGHEMVKNCRKVARKWYKKIWDGQETVLNSWTKWEEIVMKRPGNVW